VQITEAEVKHTPDAVEQKKSESAREKLSWKVWKEFPRWDLAYIELDEKQDKEKVLNRIKDNLVCQGTWSGKHHITYWKHYNTAADYEKDHGV